MCKERELRPIASEKLIAVAGGEPTPEPWRQRAPDAALKSLGRDRLANVAGASEPPPIPWRGAGKLAE